MIEYIIDKEDGRHVEIKMDGETVWKEKVMNEFDKELIEKLADKEHESWNRWMSWLYQNGTWNDDGSFTINPEKAKRWFQLSITRYDELDEDTKQYDRDEVMHILPLIKEAWENNIHENA